MYTLIKSNVDNPIFFSYLNMYIIHVWVKKIHCMHYNSQHTITCITELKRNTSDVHGVGYLVIATTNMINILDTESFKILPDKYEVIIWQNILNTLKIFLIVLKYFSPILSGFFKFFFFELLLNIFLLKYFIKLCSKLC